MYSQTDIRYSVSSTVSTVRSLVNAFPGNITLCLENKTLYQYSEYATSAEMPEDDGISVLATTDSTLLSRWLAIDINSCKSLSGTFTVADWTLSNDVYTYTIQFPNKLQNAHISLIDSNGVVVYPEEIIYTNSSGLTEVTITVGAMPNCAFNGSYSIFFDKVV